MNTLKSLLVIAMFTISASAFAHAPKKITAGYEKTSGKLTVHVPHKVKDVNDHFIESITIIVNEKEYKTISYTSQSSLSDHDVVIEIPDLKSGTVVTVKAVCNKLGSKSTSIQIK